MHFEDDYGVFFTPQERNVIMCLFSGYSNKESALAMRVEVRTIKAWVGRVAIKLQIDESKFLVRSRIVYIIAHHMGLL